VHGDKNPSLAVSIGKNGSIIVNCRSHQCKFMDIAAALGMKAMDFAGGKPERREEPRWDDRIVCTYDYRDEAGQLLYQVARLRDPKDFRQRKPIGARINLETGQRETIWKWSTKGVRRVLYRLPELLAADPRQWVIIPEGEKDCDNCAKAGLIATTNSQGAGKWHTLDEGSLAKALKGRRVCLVPDNDAAGLRHALEVAKSLEKIVAELKVLRLPELGLKQDISDWLERVETAKAEQLMTLIQLAPAWSDAVRAEIEAAIAEFERQPEADGGEKSSGDPEDIFHLAKLVLDEFGCTNGFWHLRRWSETWLLWDGAAYRVVPDEEVRATAARVIKQEFDKFKTSKHPPRISTRVVGNVLMGMSSLAILPASVVPPAWIGTPDGTDPDPSGLVPFRNGILNLPVVVDNANDHFLSPTPRLFTLYALNYDYSPDAPEPTAFLAFLNSLWPRDPESIQTLREIAGYLISGSTQYQKIFVLVGPTRSGKGTWARIQQSLMGEENCCSPTLSSLDSQFGLEAFIGKSLAIVSDARLSGRADQAAIVEELLSISGEDQKTIHRKFRGSVNQKLAVRFVILTNEPPKLRDASGALASRFVVLKLTRSFLGEEDMDLTKKLMVERCGILKWAIGGWRDLQKRGKFQQPESGAELLEDIQYSNSPMLNFLNDWCARGVGSEVECDELFQGWKEWYRLQGQEYHGRIQDFGMMLSAADPSITKTRLRSDDGRRRSYSGIRLSKRAVDLIDAAKSKRALQDYSDKGASFPDESQERSHQTDGGHSAANKSRSQNEHHANSGSERKNSARSANGSGLKENLTLDGDET
jgi:putative DNA primase/helicase